MTPHAAIEQNIGAVAAGDSSPNGATFEAHARGVAITATIHERSAGMWLAIVEAAAADEDVDGWRKEVERGRRLEIARAAERIFEAPIDDDLVTVLWVLYGPETYMKLVIDEGQSRGEYEASLIRASQRLAKLR